MNDKSKYKVLLVEDDENIARLFSYNLKKAGFICEHGIDGQEGFELTKSFNPDLIISDIMMPEVNGFEFREMLLENPKFKSIPFIFLTAKGSEDDVLKGYDLDIQEYIIKTASPKIIMAKLKAILKSREKEKQLAEKEVQKAADSMGVKVVPNNFPKFDGFDIRHWHVPFHNVPGGDFIDYYNIDTDNIAIILGDVMGKKWGAWYFAVAYAGYVRSAIRFALQDGKDLSASQIIQKVNESVYNDERISEVFVTLSIILINRQNKKVSYCGAGDLPLFHNSNGEVNLIKSQGLLLGFEVDGNYKDFEFTLKKEDELFIMTDGILESRNKDDKPLDNEGFINILKNRSDKDILAEIEEKFSAFTENNYEDDVSIIYVKAL